MHKADLKWASEVLSSATSTVPGTLDLDLRIHVSGASGLVPTLGPTLSPLSGHDSEEKMQASPISPIDKNGSMYTPTKGSRADIAAVVEEVSTQGGHSSRDIEVFRTRYGRPDIPVIIREEIEASAGPVSVNGKSLDVIHVQRSHVLSMRSFPIDKGCPCHFTFWSCWSLCNPAWRCTSVHVH